MKTIDHKSRAHAVLAPSSASRWMACPGSVNLSERMHEIAPPESSSHAEEGTLAHEVAEQEVALLLDGVQPEYSDKVNEQMIAYGKAYAQYISDEAILADKVLIEQKLDMSSAIPGCWGTVDCLVMSKGGALHVIDYKYGMGVKVDADTNYQLICYAAGAFLAHNEEYQFDKVMLTVYQPRLDHIDTWETTPYNLQKHMELLAKAARAALDGSELFADGDHCKWCPAKPICPKKLASVQKALYKCAAGNDAPTPEVFGDFLYVIEVLEKWSKSVKEAALRAAKKGRVPKDRKLVEGRKTRVWIDEKAVIHEFGVDLGEDLWTRKIITPAKLEKIVGKDQVAEFVETKPGNISLVHITDPRKPAATEAELAFEEIKESR